ncbi:hypothetical protein B0H14DRAFT_2647697 [Mycena olivaceomarginata]|nr:hypothetical protein B0H14DRAFT_2647697 [Mycena olivaceomarginata]
MSQLLLFRVEVFRAKPSKMRQARLGTTYVRMCGKELPKPWREKKAPHAANLGCQRRTNEEEPRKIHNVEKNWPESPSPSSTPTAEHREHNQNSLQMESLAIVLRADGIFILPAVKESGNEAEKIPARANAVERRRESNWQLDETVLRRRNEVLGARSGRVAHTERVRRRDSFHNLVAPQPVMHLSLCLSNAESPQPNELYDVDVGTRLASGSKTSSGCVLTREVERQSGLVDEERDMVQVDPRRWTRSFRGPERGSPCEAVKQLTREAEPLQ